MSLRAVSETYHVAGQISPDDVAEIAKAGYAAIICMRPDGEAFGQPPVAEIEAAANHAGIAFYNIADPNGGVPPETVAALKHILDTTDGVILSYCASGTRCTIAYHMAKQL